MFIDINVAFDSVCFIDFNVVFDSVCFSEFVVAFFSADGRFEVSFKANVLLQNNGFIMWIPCTIYKSSCTIDVTYFPFDQQECEMIFSSWTYNADEVNITWYLPEPSLYSQVDVSDYEKSGTWDLVGIEGKLDKNQTGKHAKYFV